ncbi:RNA-binding protein 44 isoform X2 [Anabas testudineus]|uniref:RNA-binding protein 44 isoform X2 n=1 Tax=Anabas testudineus TaxID=64144 RepID=UPI000E45C690|nr:RNA-binding protein 44 isoform X2 [Anabas testudineus]
MTSNNHISDQSIRSVSPRTQMSSCDCTNRGNELQKQPCEEIYHTKQLVHLQDSFKTAHNSPIKQKPKGVMLKERPSKQMTSSTSVFVCKDPATLGSLSLDMELERCRQKGKSGQRSQLLMTQTPDQTANFTYGEVRSLQSEWSAVKNQSSLEDYSFDSMQMDGTEYSNRSTIQSVELEQFNCPLDLVEENGTNEQGQHDKVYDNEDTDKANLSLEDQSANVCSIAEEEKSILVCVASEGEKGQSGLATTKSEALAASNEIVELDKAVFRRNTHERSTSSVPHTPTCDVMVGTELAQCVSAFTQTDDQKSADKHIVTEVHMTDLDYLAAEFLKLKAAQEKLKEKEKIQSSEWKLRNKCDCIQRAQQAELSLLTLQYSMCSQHCWRLYYSTADGDMSQYWPKDPPSNVLSVLQKLKSDYNDLRDKILEGVPLEQLKPLSVDSAMITTAAPYIPAQIIANMHGCALSRFSQEPQKHSSSGDKNGCPDNESKNGCQTKQVKESSNARRAVTLVPQGRGANHDAHKLAECQTTACKELSTSEAWYDAEEDLEPAEPAAAAEMEQSQKVTARDQTGSAHNDVKRSVLSSSSSTFNVTQSDVMLSLEKSDGSDVSTSASDNDLSGPQPAEGAGRELNSSNIQGHTSHVEHMHRAVGGSQSQASTSIRGSESSQDATKPQTLKGDCSSTERKLTAQPRLGSSIKNKQAVCNLPTAKGTCVPQHFGTMGSFDTLMTELTQRHPDVGRQKIVDALVELRAKHHDVLSSLPLRTIREMASELLTRPVSATQ